LGLAVDRGWDELVGQLGESMGESLTLLRYLDDLLAVREAALTAARRAGSTLAEGTALNNLGKAYRRLGRFEEALGCYEQALVIYRESGERHGEGTVLIYLGNAYWDLGQLDRAATCWREAAAAMHDADDHEEAGRLEQLDANARSRSQRRW